MKRTLQHLALGSCLALALGCSADKPNSFTFTADLPPDFAYVATATYVPAPGQTCTLGKNDNLKPQFNREWRTEYKPDAEIEIRQTSKGCELVLYRVELNIYAKYGKGTTDFGTDFGQVAVRHELDDRDKETFTTAGESEFLRAVPVVISHDWTQALHHKNPRLQRHRCPRQPDPGPSVCGIHPGSVTG